MIIYIRAKLAKLVNLKQLWKTALGEIELYVSKPNFITWFKNTELKSKKEGIAVINVPNGFNKEWLQNKYYNLILKTLKNLCPDIKEIQFTIEGKLSQKIKEQQNKKDLKEEQFGFEEFRIDPETNLNPKYRFDNFVVGSFNELAQAAGIAVTKHLGKLYNPLFIYGGVGLGKTHLLQAIGNEIKRKYPSKKVKYLSSEKYTSELVDALSKKGMESFKTKYRKIDVLIVDDIHFIAGKEKTQEEFFHTFNTLYHQNKQIVISADRPPKAIPTLTDRLRSRFEGGMIADISLPDLETRIAILKAKAKERNLEISEEILYYIASNISKNIRELEGALNRLLASYQLNGKELSLSYTKKILSNIISKPKTPTNFRKILECVAEFYDINPEDLINKCRKKELVHPRQVAMYLIREELKASYPFIGEKLGNRDHTTVIYACEKISKQIQEDDNLQQEINLIKERIYS